MVSDDGLILILVTLFLLLFSSNPSNLTVLPIFLVVVIVVDRPRQMSRDPLKVVFQNPMRFAWGFI